MIEMILAPSHRKDKKFMIVIMSSEPKKIIHFGQKGYEDFTIHKDEKRKELYIGRHKKREDWSISGIDKPAFYSRWILWEKPSIDEAIQNLKSKFGINITYHKNEWTKL